MGPQTSIWINIIVSGVLIGFILTLPVLIGFIFISSARRAVKKDREAFETRAIALLEEIRSVLLDSTPKNM